MSHDNRKQDCIPLEVSSEVAYSIEDGPVVVSYRKRGFLRDVHVTDGKQTRHKSPVGLNAKEILEARADSLRADLDAKGLPTDKWPVMPIELDYGYDPKEHGAVEDGDLWFEWVEDSTEPLTKDRLTAELLRATNRVLARFDEDELRDIYRAMYLYHLYSTVGELNMLAIVGEASKKSRAKGPQVKNERARAQRKLIMEKAEASWNQNLRLRGQPLNTAKKIAPAVNEERARQDPGCAPLADKTISDHIRAGLNEAEQHPVSSS